MDGQAFDDMNYNERKTIHIDLALGMKSEENSIQRLQIIKQCQQGLYADMSAMVQQGTLTIASFKKTKKTYEDILYTLGVKEADTYLVSETEAMEMIKQAKAQAAAAAQQQNPEQQADIASKMAKAQVDSAKAQQIIADINGNDAKRQLEGFALMNQHKARAF